MEVVPFIRQAMLGWQQAGAAVAARRRIVEDAVGMVELAFGRLEQQGMVELDGEREAALASNLLVVLCSDQATRPIVDTGTLYQLPRQFPRHGWAAGWKGRWSRADAKVVAVRLLWRLRIDGTSVRAPCGTGVAWLPGPFACLADRYRWPGWTGSHLTLLLRGRGPLAVGAVARVVWGWHSSCRLSGQPVFGPPTSNARGTVWSATRQACHRAGSSPVSGGRLRPPDREQCRHRGCVGFRSRDTAPRFGTVESSAGSEELLVALLETGRIGPGSTSLWHCEPDTVHLLQSMLQHWSVDLDAQISAHLDHQIGPDPKVILVVCRVVELAQRQTIGKHWGSPRVAIGKDVRSIEQRAMSKATQRAPVPIGTKHLRAENRLMEPLHGDALDVLLLALVGNAADRHKLLGDVEGDNELQLAGLVSDDPDRVDWDVEAGSHRDEPDQGAPFLVRPAKGSVLRLGWILPSVLVSKEPIRSSDIVVWRRLSWRRETGSNR